MDSSSLWAKFWFSIGFLGATLAITFISSLFTGALLFLIYNHCLAFPALGHALTYEQCVSIVFLLKLLLSPIGISKSGPSVFSCDSHKTDKGVGNV